MQIMRFVGLCLFLAWGSMAQAADMRFHVNLNFENTGVAPSIAEQVRQALPQLWQRIVPQSEQGKLHGLQAMPLLKSIHPHGLSSTIIFNEQRVWQMLKTRSVAYIRQAPSVYITLGVLDTLGRHRIGMETTLNAYLNEVSQAWGIQRSPDAPLLALHVQWLSDVQFYVSASQQGQAIQRDQNRWTQGQDAMQQLKISLRNMLLHVRSSFIIQMTSKASKPIEQQAIETLSFMLHVQGQSSLAQQIILETDLKSNPRVISMTPTLIESNHQRYRLAVKEAPERWLESWFIQRGMTATLGLEGWLAE